MLGYVIRKYCTAALSNVEEVLKKKGLRLPSKYTSTLSSGYRLELDITIELKEDGLRWYHELIGQLRWANEIGQVDIFLEVFLLSQHLVLPREGHLEQALHVMGYLKVHTKLRLMFDRGMPQFDANMFKL